MSTKRTRSSFSWTRLPRPAASGIVPEAAPSASIPSIVTPSPKRSRSDDDTSIETPPSSKRLRTDGPNLVSFGTPFECAYRYKPGGCAFRATCSYHHGVAELCSCPEVACPRGHAHRRAPRACDHGLPHQCRWNVLGECSFHHGVPLTCECSSTTCPKAHLQRTVRQKERRHDFYQKDHKAQERNSRSLFVGLPKVTPMEDPVSQELLRTSLQTALQTAAPTTLTNAIVGVQMTLGNGAFVEFRTAAIATACLQLQGLCIPGQGRLLLERPKDYSHDFLQAVNEAPIFLDTRQLDISVSFQTPAAKKKRAKPVEDTTSSPSNQSLLFAQLGVFVQNAEPTRHNDKCTRMIPKQIFRPKSY